MRGQARQSGKSETCAAFLLWYVLFNEDKTAAILANKEQIAIEILTRVQNMYLHIPLWLQQGVTEWNKKSFNLENKSRIISGTTTDDALRGFMINILVLDEFAHIPNNIAHDFFTSVYPTISSGTTSKLIICSTPRGMNAFYKMFTEAEQGKSTFKPITVLWDEVPGRDDKWKQDQIAVMGEEKFSQEQECEFLGSSGTLISSKALKNMAFMNAIKNLLENKLQIYVEPLADHSYVMVADSSHGKELDYSAFTVIDITQSPYRVVAKYRSNTIAYELYPNLIAQTGRWYNDAFALVENNEIGATVLNILVTDLEYQNLFYTKDVKTNQNLTTFSETPGVRTSKKTKRQGCLALKQLIENEQLIITDFDIIEELSAFIIQKNKTYAADVEHNDDLVMCLVLFGWMSTQQFFKDLINQDMRKKMFADKMQLAEDEMPVMPMTMETEVLQPNQELHGGIVWEVDDTFGKEWIVIKDDFYG